MSGAGASAGPDTDRRDFIMLGLDNTAVFSAVHKEHQIRGASGFHAYAAKMARTAPVAEESTTDRRGVTKAGCLLNMLSDDDEDTHKVTHSEWVNKGFMWAHPLAYFAMQPKNVYGFKAVDVCNAMSNSEGNVSRWMKRVAAELSKELPEVVDYDSVFPIMKGAQDGTRASRVFPAFLLPILLLIPSRYHIRPGTIYAGIREMQSILKPRAKCSGAKAEDTQQYNAFRYITEFAMSRRMERLKPVFFEGPLACEQIAALRTSTGARFRKLEAQNAALEALEASNAVLKSSFAALESFCATLGYVPAGAGAADAATPEEPADTSESAGASRKRAASAEPRGAGAKAARRS